jgi:hypothetical protein
MASLYEFLQAVTSAAGARLITGPRLSGRGWVQNWTDFSSQESIDRAIKEVAQKSDSIYFALGSFVSAVATDKHGNTKDKLRRTQNQCVALRSFWLDLDVGKETGSSYATVTDAASALSKFVSECKIPKPTYIVSSGFGLHVYWALTEDAPSSVWKPVAEKLKALCQQHGLLADPTRTADHSSVLRPPTTVHKKSGNEVEIVVESAPVSFAAFAAAVHDGQATPKIVAPPIDTPVLPFEVGQMNFGMETTPKKFGYLVRDNHCPQIQAMLDSGGNVHEPLWRAALSIVQHCDSDSQAQKEQWIEFLSSGHPEFNMDAALAKAAGCGAPNGCSVFQQHNPAGCKGCRTPQIGNPIKLCFPPAVLARMNGSGASKDIKPAEPPAQSSEAKSDVPLNEYNDVQYFEDALELAGLGVGSTDESLVRLPRGYFYGINNKICRRLTRKEEKKFKDEGNSTDHIEVSEFPLFITKRLRSEKEQTFKVSIRAILPLDGIVEREITLAALISERGDKVAQLIGDIGMTPSAAKVVEIRQYLARFSTALSKIEQATNTVDQLGWDGQNNFVMPGTLLTPNGEEQIFVPHEKFRTKQIAGTKEGWNATLKNFYGREDDMAYQFVIATAFGAPLVSFSSPAESAGVVSLFSTGSGAGKTTLANFAASIYGAPNAFRMQGTSTLNSVYKTLGVANSLPVVLDEISTQTDEWINNFVYSATSGQEKTRMTRDAAISSSQLRWSAPTITTSNKSVLHVARSFGGGNPAVVARVFEIDLSSKANRTDVDSTLMHKIEQNYGVVGSEWIKWLLQNKEIVAQRFVAVGSMLAKRIKHDARSRYYVQLAQIAITSAQLVRELGIAELDAEAIESWIVAQLLDRIKEDVEQASNELTSLTNFLNYARQDTVIIGSSALTAVGSGRALLARLDKKRGQIAIAAAGLTNYCDARGLSLVAQIEALHKLGFARERVRLNSGIPGALDSIAVDCFAISGAEKSLYDAVFGGEKLPALHAVSTAKESTA